MSRGYFGKIFEIYFSLALIETRVNNYVVRLTKIPEAPSANALKTSVPRRKPPSKNTGTRPCAAFTT